MIDAAPCWRVGRVEVPEVIEDKLCGYESSGEPDIFLSVEAQVQPLRKQKVGVRPVCVRRDSDFEKVNHNTVKNSGIV